MHDFLHEQLRNVLIGVIAKKLYPTELDRQKATDKIMKSSEYKRWCNGGPCACMGCCNRLLFENYLNVNDWNSWVIRHNLLK